MKLTFWDVVFGCLFATLSVGGWNLYHDVALDVVAKQEGAWVLLCAVCLGLWATFKARMTHQQVAPTDTKPDHLTRPLRAYSVGEEDIWAAEDEAQALRLANDLQTRLQEREGRINELQARLLDSELALHNFVNAHRSKLEAASVFCSAGEAAYAHTVDFEESSQDWANANQDLWEEAACGAILYGNQYAAHAQIAFFKQGARVPYYIGEGEAEGKVFTAHLTSPDSGGVTISVDGEEVRHLQTENLEHAIRWFTNVVKAPPGWIIF